MSPETSFQIASVNVTLAAPTYILNPETLIMRLDCTLDQFQNVLESQSRVLVEMSLLLPAVLISTETPTNYCSKRLTSRSLINATFHKTSQPRITHISIEQTEKHRDSSRIPRSSLTRYPARSSPLRPNWDGWSPSPAHHPLVARAHQAIDRSSTRVIVLISHPHARQRTFTCRSP